MTLVIDSGANQFQTHRMIAFLFPAHFREKKFNPFSFYFWDQTSQSTYNLAYTANPALVKPRILHLSASGRKAIPIPPDLKIRNVFKKCYSESAAA